MNCISSLSIFGCYPSNSFFNLQQKADSLTGAKQIIPKYWTFSYGIDFCKMSLGKLSSLELVNSFKKLTNGTFSVVEPSKNKKDVVISTVMPTRVEPDQVQQQQQQHDLDETPEEEV